MKSDEKKIDEQQAVNAQYKGLTLAEVCLIREKLENVYVRMGATWGIDDKRTIFVVESIDRLTKCISEMMQGV